MLIHPGFCLCPGPRGAPENGLKKDKGAVGYIVVTPMKLADGSEVLINRGWVPTIESRTAEQEKNGLVTIVGVLTNGEARPPFLGDYELGSEEKPWIYLDAEMMSQHMNLSAPQVAGSNGEAPKASTGPARVSNLSSSESEEDSEDADMRNVLHGGALVVEALGECSCCLLSRHNAIKARANCGVCAFREP